MLSHGIPRFLCAPHLLASLLLASVLLLVTLSRAENTLGIALPSGAPSLRNTSPEPGKAASGYLTTSCPHPDAGPPALATSEQEATQLAALAKSEAFDSVASASASPTHLASRSKLLAQLTVIPFPAREAVLALRSTSDLTPILRC